MTQPNATYLRNPMTDDVVKADQALASKLRSYGWQWAKLEDYRRAFVRQQTQQLLRHEVN